ncbi:MAG TPA: LysM peptidoglycan-binding domain-containing protein [Pyrinomonadaceae bacterium]|nr:LysM peptidoglycan-binding domain-containing protein [Pyrinomonadaceae bacterium]
MNSQALAQLLLQQSSESPHEIRLNDTTIGTSGLDALVKENLVRADGTVVLVVSPSDIPPSPSPSGFTLAATVPAGGDSFLSLDGRKAQVEFITGPDTTDIVLTVWTRQTPVGDADWVFSQSFPELANQIYDDLTFDGPVLVLSTGASGQPAAGLSFAATLTLDGIFETVASLLGVSDQYPLKGALTRGKGGFAFDLQAQIGAEKRLGTDSVNITMEDSFAGVALTPVVTDKSSTVITSLYLGADVQFQTSQKGQLPLDIQVQLPVNTTSPPVLVLSVTPFHGTPVAIASGGAVRASGTTTVTTAAPHGLSAGDYATVAFVSDSSFNGTFPVAATPTQTTFTYAQKNTPDATSGGGTVSSGINTSLMQLGELVGGAAWDDFFQGPAAPLKSYFETFGLLGFNATFMPSTASVSSISLSVGTLQPWTMWDGYTVTLSAAWDILFLGGATAQTLDLKADFNFKTINFLLDIQLPQLLITGRESGAPISYSLADLNNDLFEGKLAVPQDLLTVSVADFYISIDVPNKQFSIGATASASVALFGTPLLGIHDMRIAVSVDASGATTLYTATIDGQVSLGTILFQTDATITNDPTKDTVLSLHLVDETVGSMLNHLVHLVDPTYDISLPDPWGKFLDIKLDALVLRITLPGQQSKTPRSVALTYNAEIDLGFIKINSISLVYLTGATATQGSNVTVAISGSFLGQQFGADSSGTQSSNPPLAWDAMNGSPPTVPGQGSSLFDLQYAGLGQHVAFQGVELTTVQQVMTALRQSVLPSPSGQLPPFGQNGLAFSAQSNWHVGAQFTVMGTLAISAIFNDPNLYGILIQLSGAKAKIFAGLSFEILYRKVTDKIGVYHIELKLPDAMRNLQFGEVSITLPVVILDIYTNGNFRVDLGFPVGLDFSNSFCIQVFPFVGYGGFYFALLDGATSTRVPQITNGTFSPVIEFGVALSIGVGKTVNEGILSGGISVTVVGILQGVLAWFRPTDGSSDEMYYWFQGSISIVGRLYATINFAIIQASLDVTAYATVTLTIESHKPILIAISAGVSVRVSVKIVFFTIHLSFHATINASFTIGSATPTPWQLAPAGGGSANTNAQLHPTGLRALPQMRGQQTLHAPAPLHSHATYSRALRRSMLEAAPPSDYLTNWPAVCVLPQGAQTVTVWATPAFTKSESWPVAPGGASRSSGVVTVTTAAPHDLDAGDTVTLSGVSDSSFDGTFAVTSVPNTTQFVFSQGGQPDATASGGTATAGQAAGGADAVFLFAAQNSIAPDAATLNEHRALYGAAPESAPFNLLMQAMLAWGVYVETNNNSRVTAGQLADLQWQLQQSQTVDAAFDYATLTAFLAANFTFQVGTEPDGTTSVALFPAFPAVTLTDSAGTSVDFGSFDSVDENYQEKVQAYFRLLQVQYEERNKNGGANEALAAEDSAESMATVVFSQYFNMLMAAGVKAAVDLLASYPFTPTTAMSIADVASAVQDPTLDAEPSRVVSPNQDLPVLSPRALFTLPGVVHQIRAGETFASVASDFAQEGALDSAGKPYTLADLLDANNATAGIYNVGVPVAFSALTYTTQPNDTLNLIAARLLLRSLGPSELSSINGFASTADALARLNPTVKGTNLPLAVSVAPAAQGGASRASDTVTVTTTSPHGLAQGASVALAGVADSSFDGTFTVESVPGPLQFTYAQAGADAASGDGTAAALASVAVGAVIAPADGGAVRASGVTTFTTTAAHNFAEGDLVAVSGVADSSFNGTFTVISVPTAQSFTVQQGGQSDAKSGGGLVGLPSLAAAQGSTYSVVTGDTLTLVAAYFLAVAQGTFDIQTYVASLLQLNTSLTVTDPTQPQPAGTSVTLPPVPRAVAAGDTIYSMATTMMTTPAVVQQTLTSLPATPQLLAPQGVLRVPLSYAVAAGDTFASVAQKFDLTLDELTEAALSVEGLFAPQTWQITSGGAARASGTTTVTTAAPHGLAAGNSVILAGVTDTSFDGTFTVASVPSALTFTFVQASQPDATSGGGSVSRPLTVNDLPSIDVQTMMTDLVTQAEWNNASAMVSRFLLSGLRLPDPSDPYFQSLSVDDLLDPTKLAGIRTKPLFKLTGQQYSLPAPVPSNYQITLTNTAGASWLQLGTSGSVTLPLNQDQQNLMQIISETALDPGISTLTRLALFQMLPPRVALQNHIAWQAAVAPAGCLSTSTTTGNPSVWLFPDSLLQQLDSVATQQQSASTLLYEVVVAKHHAADQPVVAAQADCYAWATIIDFTVSPPVAESDAPSLANLYVVGGADDAGAATLQQVYNYLADAANNATAALYLLYSPNPTSANPSGLVSDELNPASTFILKTNLSTLTHSSGALFAAFEAQRDEATRGDAPAVPDPTSVYAAAVSDAADFVALLWEASVTRSGGFYLSYVNQNGGAALPASVFGDAGTATLSLLVVIDSQAATRDAAILPFNNCAVVGDNIDTTTSSVFVQPATYTVQPGDNLQGVLNGFNSDWGTQFTLQQFAGWNAAVPLLLEVGATLATPGGGSYTIDYGDTLASIVSAGVFPDLNTLLSTGNNSTSPVLAPGAAVQFADGVLQPSTVVPPGTVGFEMTRANPDPDNLPLDQLQPAQIVSSLFNLVGFSVAAAGGFTPSGEGLPTTPADSTQAQSDGLTPRDLGDSNDPFWYYQQMLSVYPFGPRAGASTSAALPPSASDPYNGVGYAAGTKDLNEVTINLNLQDTYGNAQSLQSPFGSLRVPVGYYDQIASLGSWPSLAVSYEVTGKPPVLSLNMTMQQARYTPSPSVDVTSALSAIAADLKTYTNIYYQLAQPDFALTLRTTLDARSMQGDNPGYALSKTPFLAFASGAYVYLAALSTMQAVTLDVSGATTSVPAVTTLYGVTAPQLFTANQNALYSALFGSAVLTVPQMYAAVEGDSLQSIAAKWPQYNLTPASLAEANKSVALNPGTDLQVATARAVTASPTVAAIAAAPAGAVRSDGVVTVTTESPHDLAANDYVSVAGVADSSFDGTFTVVSVTDETHFTYAQPSAADAQSGGGTSSTLTPSLAALAHQAHASAAAVAVANHGRTDILQQGASLAFGALSYTVGQNDTLDNAARQLDTTVANVADANQYLEGVFVAGASLDVTDVLASEGDTLLGLANAYAGGDLGGFAALNQSASDIFAPTTALRVGVNQSPAPPAADDTLTTFAAANKVTVADLADENAANASALFVSGAQVAIPGVLLNASAAQFSTYTASKSGETLGSIAQKFGRQPADIAALNADAPGLLAGGQSVTDQTSGKTVSTQDGDTFDSLIARFASQYGVTVTPAQLAADVAAQPNLVVAQSLWLAPPMLGAAGGRNTSLSLEGLASAYNTDAQTVAASNAAAIGFLASGQTFTLFGVQLTTNEYETLNSLVNRVTEQGATVGGHAVSVSDVVSALASQPNLVNAQASVVPVPPPSPAQNGATLNPQFTEPVFQILVNVVSTRDPGLVDPDFAGVSSVVTSTYGVAPEPNQTDDPSAPFTITEFASNLQDSLPGLQVATGDPVAEGDPASASTIWAANFGNSNGPSITFAFEGAGTQYFALPPLSTSLMGGSVNVVPYVSGQKPPFTGQAQAQTFQAVDLDTWLNTFLQAVDTFLSPAYAGAAYALDPASTVGVVKQKQRLAQALSQRLQYVLAGQSGGSEPDAVDAIYQAMLTELSSAFTVDTLVQVPVQVANPGASDPLAAPRLSGKLIVGDEGGVADPSLPNAFSFSTAKVSLTDSTSQAKPTATFLFSVKAPAGHKHANLNLQYVVNELELPDPSSIIGSYEGSSWLKFVLPLDGKQTSIGDVDIPIPLRAYPSPVSLVAQTAAQSVPEPQNATSLLPWDFDFVYQHDDAEQDTPLVVVTFNATGPPTLPYGAQTGGFDLTQVFNRLAQFMAVWPALKTDLDLLTRHAAGSPPDPNAVASIAAFGKCVEWVADSFNQTLMGAPFMPPTLTYYYQLQKQQTGGATPTLMTLTVTSVDPTTMQPKANPTVMWPAVAIQQQAGGTFQALTPETQTDTAAVYNYPAGIAADAPLLQYFLFGAWAVTQNGAVRASGTVTVTTESPHGLAAGDTVSVAGVADSSFNGTFAVASVPSSQSLTYAQAGADAASGGGTLAVLAASPGEDVIPPSAAALSAPQIFSFRLGGGGLDAAAQQSGLNVLTLQSGRAGVSISRNLSLIAGQPTNGEFVYQTPLTSFTANAVPSVFADAEIIIGSPPTSVGAALGAFLQSLLTSQNLWTTSADTLTVRLAAGYSYALATSPSNASGLPELNAVVPILLVPSQSFDPLSDWQYAPNSSTFVSQIEAAILFWQSNNQPSQNRGSYVFDLTIYASQGQLQPLIHATNLQYKLSAD